MTACERRPAPPTAAIRVLASPSDATASANPYIRLLYAAVRRAAPGTRIQEFRPRALLEADTDRTIWHLHWPLSMVSEPSSLRLARELPVFIGAVELARRSGIPVVWTIHNMEPHERHRPWLSDWFERWLPTRIAGAIALTAAGAVEARSRFPGLGDRPIAVIPHGHYMDVYPAPVPDPGIEGLLGPDDEVVLFIGQVRPYKEVTSLIRAFRGLDAPAVRLVVAGAPSTEEVARDVRGAAAGDERVVLRLGHVPDATLSWLLERARLVVAPYRRVTNSGVLFLGLSFGRPVLVPDTPVTREVRDAVGGPLVLTYQGDLTAADLGAALAAARPADPPRRAAIRAALDWDEIGRRTVGFYRQLLAAGDRTARP